MAEYPSLGSREGQRLSFHRKLGEWAFLNSCFSDSARAPTATLGSGGRFSKIDNNWPWLATLESGRCLHSLILTIALCVYWMTQELGMALTEDAG
jgi:hypothetical protein